MDFKFRDHFDYNFVADRRIDKWHDTGWNQDLRVKFLRPDLPNMPSKLFEDRPVTKKFGEWIPHPDGHKHFDYYSNETIKAAERNPDYQVARSQAFPHKFFGAKSASTTSPSYDRSFLNVVHASVITEKLRDRCRASYGEILTMVAEQAWRRRNSEIEMNDIRVNDQIFTESTPVTPVDIEKLMSRSLTIKEPSLTKSSVLTYAGSEALRQLQDRGLDPLFAYQIREPGTAELIKIVSGETGIDPRMFIENMTVSVVPIVSEPVEPISAMPGFLKSEPILQWTDTLPVGASVTIMDYCGCIGIEYPASRGERRKMNGILRRVSCLRIVRTPSNSQAVKLVLPDLYAPIFQKDSSKTYLLPRIPEHNRQQLH